MLTRELNIGKTLSYNKECNNIKRDYMHERYDSASFHKYLEDVCERENGLIVLRHLTTVLFISINNNAESYVYELERAIKHLEHSKSISDTMAYIKYFKKMSPMLPETKKEREFMILKQEINKL
jgi:hypothetical protein